MHPSVQVGLVNIEIHHTRIRSSDLCDIRIAESSSHLSRAAPFPDLFLNARISALNDACDHGMSLAIALKVCNHLAYSAAGITFTQPGRDVRVVIIQGLYLLYIYKDNRHIQILYSRQHIVGCCVCKELHDHQVNVRRAELVARFLGLLFCRHHAAVDDLNGIRDRLLERLILSLELRHQ